MVESQLRPEVRSLASKAARELQELGRRQQLVERVSAERNRKSSARSEAGKAQIDRHIEWLKGEIKTLNEQIQVQLNQSEQWQQQQSRLQSVLRVGVFSEHFQSQRSPPLFSPLLNPHLFN